MSNPPLLYPSSDIGGDQKTCRICLETDETPDDVLIAPCRCSGTMKYVHRKCLQEWRAQEQVPMAFSHCPQCKFQYVTELNEGEQKMKRVWLTLFVARDTIGLFLCVQGVAAALALLIHACDPGGFIKKLYPDEWAESHAAVHFSVGPYYVTSVILLLALLGVVGTLMVCCGKVPQNSQRESRHAPRWRRRGRHRGDGGGER